MRPCSRSGRPLCSERSGARLRAVRRPDAPFMSTEPSRRLSIRPAALVAAAVAVVAVIVLVVVLAGGGGDLEVADTIEVGDSPSNVAVGLDAVWVVASGGGTLSKVDPDDKKVTGRPVQVGE